MSRGEVRLPRQRTQIVGAGLAVLLLGAVGGSLLSGCSPAAPEATTPASPSPQASTLVFYNWAGYMPQSVLDAFASEYGIKVDYQIYETQEAAELDLRAGKVYDVVVMSNDLIPGLVADGLLATIDYRHVPNFKNVAANFRDLAYDPGNAHSVMFQWSTSGLLVRADLVKGGIKRWADLWDPRYAGKIGLWAIQRDVLGLALKALGYSANSEKPAELEAALQRLLVLKPNVFTMDMNLPSSVPFLASGEAAVVYGWPFDVLEARNANLPVEYILPEEGTMLYGDNLVIPANSPRKAEAETFIDFILRPEISAQIVNEIMTGTANEAALPLVDPAIRNDPVIFPPTETLKGAEIILPLSPQGKKLYEETWQRFLDASPVLVDRTP